MEFIESKLKNLYLHELHWLSYNIKENCEFIFKETEQLESDISVSPEIHIKIITVLTYAANIKKILFPHLEKKKREKVEQFEFRKKRAKALQHLLKNIILKEILDAKVRNSLEHFDEYLDKANLQLINNKVDTSAVYNMTFSHWEISEKIGISAYPIRLYLSKNKIFFNFDLSINIGKIYEEAIQLLNTLKEMDLPDKPGGWMISLK
jgi:hypothetical protein